MVSSNPISYNNHQSYLIILCTLKPQTLNIVYIFFSQTYNKGVLNVLEGSDREINMEPGIAEKDI